MNRAASLIASTLIVFFAAGCAEDGPERFPLSGNVSFQGTPLAEGSIRFVPEDKAQAQEGAMIRNGKYSATLTRGRKKVVIEAFREKTGGGAANIPVRPGGVSKSLKDAKETEMFVPEQYNSKSTLTVEAGPDTSSQDFDLN